MFIINVSDIVYPEGSSEDLPSSLTLAVEEVINNEYLDAELANHVEEVVGVLPTSLKYDWKYDHYFQDGSN
jgi:hypothetical protein